MMKHSVSVVVAMVVAALAADVMAQGGRGGRGGGGGLGGGASKMALLQVTSVQEELGLEEVQIEDIQAMRRDLRGGRGQGGRGGDRPNFRDMTDEERQAAFAEMREQAAERQKQQDEKLADILDSDQVKRLNEIFVQVAGIGALGDPQIQEELDISAEQAEEIGDATREAGTEMREEMRELFQSGDREAIREKMTEMRKQIEEAVMDKLTASQREQFEDMKGEPFELSDEDQRSLRGGGRGGRGGGQGGPGGGGRARGQRPEAE